MFNILLRIAGRNKTGFEIFLLTRLKSNLISMKLETDPASGLHGRVSRPLKPDVDYENMNYDCKSGAKIIFSS